MNTEYMNTEYNNVFILLVPIILTISVAQRFALWALDMELPGWIPGRSNLERTFSKLVLVWVPLL